MYYLSIDIGAESGRMMLGNFSDTSFSIKEIYRFSNGMLQIGSHFHWNIYHLYKEILVGFEKLVQVEKVIPLSIGIDTWGVDFGLLTKDGTLIGLPFAYRDPRNEMVVDEVLQRIPAQELYSLTGTLNAPYNTVFQLFAANKFQKNNFSFAKKLLFIPDLISWLLSGSQKTESSFAATSQLFNPFSYSWESEIFSRLELPIDIMPEVIPSGKILGYLSDSVCKMTGMKQIPIVTVATHDTNSAVAAIPATEKEWAFISSGTWSIVGFENLKPIINKTSFQLNISNEIGLCNTFHLLKNHTGLWMLQECKKIWKKENYHYSELVQMATSEDQIQSIVDVDHPIFLNPENMQDAINQYLVNTNQPLPKNHAETTRIIFNSLATTYKKTIEEMTQLREVPFDALYITGGGAKNALLCQITADYSGLKVVTGVEEGSAVGNMVAQALSAGQFNSLSDARSYIQKSIITTIYIPK